MSVEIPVNANSESGTRTAAVFFALALVCIITFAARGSFGLFPLGEADTVVSNNTHFKSSQFKWNSRPSPRFQIT